MNFNRLITGQIILRDPQTAAPDGSTRKLIAFVGIIAVPQDTRLIGEHQYVLYADPTLQFDTDEITLTLALSTAKDVSAISMGSDLGHLVTEPIWRC